LNTNDNAVTFSSVWSPVAYVAKKGHVCLRTFKNKKKYLEVPKSIMADQYKMAAKIWFTSENFEENFKPFF
jgi:hypothetical protein